MARSYRPSTRLLVGLLALFATAGNAGTAEVRLRVQVPIIAQADGPQSVTLKPGERRLVPVKVAANYSWKLSVVSGNPAVSVVTVSLQGAPGGYLSPGNSVELELQCDASAEGDQTAAMQYLVDRR